jgi:hypothetical protein
MRPKRSLYRAAALTGAAAFLLSFAHVGPAAAQTSTRFTATCTAILSPAEFMEQCNMIVPEGKVFVVESATVHGFHPSTQYVQVLLVTKVGYADRRHAVPAGFQVLSNTSRTMWGGAIPGTIFGEGHIELDIYRGPSASGYASFEATLSGHLEDVQEN